METKDILSNSSNQYDNINASKQDASDNDSELVSQLTKTIKKKTQKETVLCTCGKSISRSSMAYHIKTQEHINKDKEIREKKMIDLVEKHDQVQVNVILNNSELKQDLDDDSKKLKLCSCGERISVANMASHVKRRTHINKIAEQYARIEEIDKLNVTSEMKKMLVDKILIKGE